MQPPLIVIGMHRSGTSLLVRLLAELGLCMGSDWDAENSESLFFQRTNDRLLHDAGASWYRPAALELRLLDREWCHSWATRLTELCDSLTSARYLNRSRFTRRPLTTVSGAWGWKDPRNTLTLPLWLQVFPQAKVLHVVRNAVDVSQSLVERERRLSARRWTRFKRSVVRPLVPQWLHPTQPRACTTLEAGFELWVDYLEFAAEATRELPPERYLEFRYEDLIAAPREYLSVVAEFAGLDTSPEQFERATGQINRQRASAFLKDQRLRQFYETCRLHPLMRQFGYSELIGIEACCESVVSEPVPAAV